MTGDHICGVVRDADELWRAWCQTCHYEGPPRVFASDAARDAKEHAQDGTE